MVLIEYKPRDEHLHLGVVVVHHHDGQMVSGWLLGVPDGQHNRPAVRQLRGHLWRIHNEREHLVGMLRALELGALPLTSTAKRAVQRKAAQLCRTTHAGLPQQPMLALAQSIDRVLRPEAADHLRFLLEEHEEWLLASVDEFLRRSGAGVMIDGQLVAPPSQILLDLLQGGLHVQTGNNYSLHGDGSSFVVNTGNIGHLNMMATTALAELEKSIAAFYNAVESPDRVELMALIAKLKSDLMTEPTPERTTRLRHTLRRISTIAAAGGLAGAAVINAVENLLNAIG